jgi:alkanesulfonate monooxygenase SsuD/methylene tetrahydromethanopterin reductase-like flavin-dependent oxidoreductase (luciferase family)
MAKIGYFLSSEQFDPAQLVDQANRAEAAGFDALWVSDHFHPWNDEQGERPVRLGRDRRAVAGDDATGDHGYCLACPTPTW